MGKGLERVLPSADHTPPCWGRQTQLRDSSYPIHRDIGPVVDSTEGRGEGGWAAAVFGKRGSVQHKPKILVRKGWEKNSSFFAIHLKRTHLPLICVKVIISKNIRNGQLSQALGKMQLESRGLASIFRSWGNYHSSKLQGIWRDFYQISFSIFFKRDSGTCSLICPESLGGILSHIFCHLKQQTKKQTKDTNNSKAKSVQ